jgi:MASE9 protein
MKMKSPTKTQEVQSISQPARLFIGLTVLGGAVVTGWVALAAHAWPHLPFLAMLAITLPASRLKLKLPGLNGNMSVNLPFILLAAATLSAFEALVLATVSAAVQSLPRDGSKIKPVQMIFNVSTMAIAVWLTGGILHGGAHLPSTWASAATRLVLAGAGLLLAQTLPVATIISLTEGGCLHRIWLHIFQLSFPYYVLGTGITSLLTTVSKHVGWQIPLLAMPVMYAIYRSYRLYFREGGAQPSPLLRAKAAAAN